MNRFLMAGAATFALLGMALAASDTEPSKASSYKPIASEADKNACLGAGGKVVIFDGSLMCQLPATDQTKKAG